MKLIYSELPQEIRKIHSFKDIHKILKPTHTLISVHLKDHSRVNWKKSGSAWIIQNTKS